MSGSKNAVCSDTGKIKYPDKISAVARAIHLRRTHSRLLKALIDVSSVIIGI